MTNVEVSVDTRGMNCPQPLIEARKKLRKMDDGQVLEVIGDHGVSRKEIPMAVEKPQSCFSAVNWTRPTLPS